ncbi:IS66 family insertion sequence element accessory protein TnpB [Rhizobium phaseoli]|uniref:IS66 family insertion sequence element accessory protein TnpB n=1 Tax=Rhizobium phaseoli TaxID=396 RepID=UPI000A1C117E|nr:IS66 family insertion sequence transposase domain-containing protein [Rhizobium phaseoli Brasil 5]
MGIKDETDALPALTAYLRWQWLYSVVRYKRIVDGEFHWPRMQDGAMHLTAAQFSALFEGLDWKRVHTPSETRIPTKAG